MQIGDTLGATVVIQGTAKVKARLPYEKLLEYWADGDPCLPEFEDARQRLAGLTE